MLENLTREQKSNLEHYDGIVITTRYFQIAVSDTDRVTVSPLFYCLFSYGKRKWFLMTIFKY